MSDRESSAVGYRLRGFGPTDLSTFPASVKLMFWRWVVELGLDRKEKELLKGWDKDGKVHQLRPKTIKYRRSEVGPVRKTAPRLVPALDLSRVISLLTGREHEDSAEFWWKYDSHSGDSFAVILHYQAEVGHDVFGLSPQGTAWVTAEALKRWAEWKAENPPVARLANVQGAKPVRKAEILRPIAKKEIKGRFDFENMDLFEGAEERLKRAVAEGQVTGFRRLNMRGEQWKPGTGIGTGEQPPKPQIAAMKPAAPIVRESPVTPASVKTTPQARLAELSAYTETLGVPSRVIDVEAFTTRFAGAAIDKARAAYDPKTREIYWNLNSPAWADSKKHFETQRKEKLLADPRPIGVAHHEVGHALLHTELIRRHGLEEGTRRYWDLARDEFKADILIKSLVKKAVSRVAALDKNEFVAEVYSGLVIGRKYPDEVLALYDDLGGVRPYVPPQPQ